MPNFSFARAAVAVLAFIVFLAGCATGTSPITQQQVSAIQRGKTTKEEIRKSFGEPRSVTATAGGEMWMYDHANSLFSTDAYQQLFITFSGNRVKDFQHSAMKRF